MAQPIWRELIKVDVPGSSEPKRQWVLALEFLNAGKVMKIETVSDKEGKERTWKPKGFDKGCDADGDLNGDTRKPNVALEGTPILSNAPRGALIARIGGSTADQIVLTKDGAFPSTYVLFPVGRKCIFAVPPTPVGSLFLGVNDDQTRMTAVEGTLQVAIYEAI